MCENSRTASAKLLSRAEYIFKTVIENQGIEKLSKRLGMKWILCGAFCSVHNPNLLKKFEECILYTRDNIEKSYKTCAFVPYLSEVFMKYAKDSISDDIKEYLEEISKSATEYSLNDCWDFIDVNDNTPAMIMTFLFLTGERTGNKSCIEIAEKRLRQYEEILDNRTFIAEFNSQTYHAINITAVSALARYTKNENIRKRALMCVEKLWKQTFLMYHRDSGVLSGPYSRSYSLNSLSRTSQMKMMLYLAMGDRITISPLDTIFSNEQTLDSMMKYLALISEGALFAAVYQTCPGYIVETSLSENYPISVFGDAQISASADQYLVDELDIFKEKEIIAELSKQENVEEYSAGVSKIMAYKNKYYTLGTCTKEFHNGIQTDSFHSVVCENSPVKTETEITAIFSRYFINDENISLDMGRKVAFQHENTALVCYTPKIYTEDISSLKLSILIGNTDGFEIYSDRKMLKLGDELNSDKPIVFRFKNVYAAVISLKQTHIKIEKINECIAVSFIDYLGEPRHFAKKELKLIRGGFAFEIRNSEECKSDEEFYNIISNYECSDRLYTNIHTRYAIERNAYYRNENKELKCLYSPISEGIEYIRVNRKNII